MATYKVSVFAETGGYVYVEAENQARALRKVQRLIDERGEEAITDVTHGSIEILHGDVQVEDENGNYDFIKKPGKE